MGRMGGNRTYLVLFLVIAALFAAACNLTSAPQEQLELTDVPTNTVLPTRTLIADGTAPTPVTVTSLPFPTAQRPTAIAILPPTAILFPTSTPLPVSIAILSPVPGNTVAGNVQIYGAASHPNFLQYQLEWGPDPNPSNLWFLAGGVVQNPVINGMLGTWNSTAVQDGQYQLRLKVFLRDGTNLATVVNNIRVQNRIPTLVPTVTTLPRPIAAFSVDRVSGQSPLVVRFFNQSSGNISSFSWNFGDGGSSSEFNPTHTFRNPGVFNVTLQVRGPGGTSNVSRQIVVQSSTPPVAGFTQDKTSGASPLTVQFTDQSQGNITQRVWNFGDATTSNEVNPSHIFTAVGTYNVFLTVSGPGGSSSVTRQITVENPTIPEPIAALVPSQTEGEAPLTVQFDASDSSGQIDSYNWNFDDGKLGSGQIVTHTFADAGLYEVQLVVVGPGGQSAKQVEINVVKPPDAPSAGIAANPVSGNVPLTVNFDASSSTGPIDSYSWNFGDGAVGNGVATQHTYNAAGTYTVELIVKGPGGSNSAFIEISAVEPIPAPKAAFDTTPASGPAPLDVQFTNQSEGEELTFEWTFGDGSPTSDDRDPLHRYESAGDYEVTLKVTSPGGTDSASKTVTVTEPDAPPVAALGAFPVSGPAPLEVQFANQTVGDNLTFEWTFGDGSPASNERDPKHTFTAAGDFTVTLTVTGSGGSDSASITISATAPLPLPDASFTANPTSGEAPLTVNFDSTGDPNNISTYYWEFGDGATGDSADPQHIYAQANTYTARLTVSDVNGRQSSSEMAISVSVAVVIAPPVAGFSLTPPTGTVGQPVQFTNTTTGDVTSYQWDFGDGNTATDASPQHTYTAPGNYPVILTATGPGGQNVAQASYGVVPAEQPPQPSIVDQIPILPEIASQQVRNQLRTIFDSGTAQGKRAAVFTVIGGDMATQNGYLRPFADPGLNTGAPELQSIIDWYNQIDLGDGRSSFDHASAAASSSWRVQDLLDPGRSGGNCDGGETPLDCELRLVQPSVAVISVGLNDVGATAPDTFRATLEQVLQVLLNNGVIPVVTTIQPNPNNVDAVRAINEALITAAQNVEAANGTVIPIYNLWRAYNQLPGSGLEGSTPTTAPSGPGILSPDAVGTYATNTRNSNVLTILDQLRSQVFPDASAG